MSSTTSRRAVLAGAAALARGNARSEAGIPEAEQRMDGAGDEAQETLAELRATVPTTIAGALGCV